MVNYIRTTRSFVIAVIADASCNEDVNTGRFACDVLHPVHAGATTHARRFIVARQPFSVKFSGRDINSSLIISRLLVLTRF